MLNDKLGSKEQRVGDGGLVPVSLRVDLLYYRQETWTQSIVNNDHINFHWKREIRSGRKAAKIEPPVSFMTGYFQADGDKESLHVIETHYSTA
ncbi:hypothetical protein KUCAC02_016065 [Chaenocephalus aceratus]|uniref:Uncharacterized protein n=1 Tax=Chaenocephalus aceratus TaxID=36190 RepID=A0ACB9XZ94_CHAAC|nr:hypothetical protein KUCAC02_016065 [Chaenocephalus aceratus]